MLNDSQNNDKVMYIYVMYVGVLTSYQLRLKWWIRAIRNRTFCDRVVIYHATSVLLRFKQFSTATSIWKSSSPRISKGLSLLAIFHLLHLQLLAEDQRRFNVPDYLMSFWNAWIIVGGYGSVIKGHRALIGPRLSQFGRHAYAMGNPASQNGCESDISLTGLAGHPHKLCIVSSP